MTIDGEAVPAAADGQGYLRLRREWNGPAQVVLELPMPVRLIAPHPRIDAVRGCLALARGPLVYCIEQADHPRRRGRGPPPRSRRAARAGRRRRGLGVPVTLVGPATVHTAPSTPTTLTAIPYFRWANRGPNAMRVWIPTF